MHCTELNTTKPMLQSNTISKQTNLFYLLKIPKLFYAIDVMASNTVVGTLRLLANVFDAASDETI